MSPSFFQTPHPHVKHARLSIHHHSLSVMMSGIRYRQIFGDLSPCCARNSGMTAYSNCRLFRQEELESFIYAASYSINQLWQFQSLLQVGPGS